MWWFGTKTEELLLALTEQLITEYRQEDPLESDDFFCIAEQLFGILNDY